MKLDSLGRQVCQALNTSSPILLEETLGQYSVAVTVLTLWVGIAWK